MAGNHVKPRLYQGLDGLAKPDRALLLAMATMALATLALGVVFGAGTGFIRAGFVDLYPETGYRLMTLHGVTVFFYWLYFGQATVLLALAAAYAEGDRRIALPSLAWLGFAAMTVGFASSEAGTLLGLPLLYDGPPELVGEERLGAGLFYLGYLLLAAGLFLVAISAIATPLRARRMGEAAPWSTVTFATVAWAGLVMVSAFAAFDTFLPAAAWVMGLTGAPQDHSTSWHLLFHNLHYLPLMGTVLIWYVLTDTLTGVSSIFGTRFSKIVFALYLVFVPPTSLYHMFLEPGLAAPVRVAGSLLSLFVGVPTIAVFLIVVISLESTARAQGARGMFGWLGRLPWGDPAMSAMAMAVVSLAFGGVLAFVLIQEQLAPLLSDTFFVPGYFHFLTVGTVSLTLLAMLAHLIPRLCGRPLWRPGVLTVLPYVTMAGLAVFAFAGVGAGLLGVPRRALDVSYDGAASPAWQPLMSVIGVGAVVMTAGLIAYVYGLARTLAGSWRLGGLPDTLPDTLPVGSKVQPGIANASGNAWTGPLSIVVLLVGMYAATSIAFLIMRSLPLVASGGAGH
jgi:cytochrome c oxidase subunit 1